MTAAYRIRAKTDDGRSRRLEFDMIGVSRDVLQSELDKWNGIGRGSAWVELDEQRFHVTLWDFSR